jgi:hypothetical protein
MSFNLEKYSTVLGWLRSTWLPILLDSLLVIGVL